MFYTFLITTITIQLQRLQLEMHAKRKGNTRHEFTRLPETQLCFSWVKIQEIRLMCYSSGKNMDTVHNNGTHVFRTSQQREVTGNILFVQIFLKKTFFSYNLHTGTNPPQLSGTSALICWPILEQDWVWVQAMPGEMERSLMRKSIPHNCEWSFLRRRNQVLQRCWLELWIRWTHVLSTCVKKINGMLYITNCF